MKVCELDSNRFKTALEFLEEGHSFEFSGVEFWLDKENKILQVSAFTNWKWLENLTEQIALSEIQRGKEVFNYLFEQSSRFKKIVRNYEPRFSLIRNLGNALYEICYLADEKLIWN